MRIFKNFLALMVLLNFGAVFAQDYHASCSDSYLQNKYFNAGESVYTYNLKGLSMYLNDIRTDQPELYARLQPRYSKMKNRQTGAIVSFCAGSVIGSALIVSAFDYSPGFTAGGDIKNDMNSGKIIAGGVVFLSGLVTSLFLYPKESDFFDFINNNNRNTKGDKLQLNIGVGMIESKATGLSFALRF